MTITETHRPSRGDRIGLWTFAVAGVAIAGWAVWTAIARIIEVLPNKDVAVLAAFSGTQAMAPIGPDGAEVAVELDQAIVTAPSLPDASLAAIVIQQLVLAASVVGVVVCLIWLIRNMAVGTVFSRTNSVLVTSAGFLGIAGYFLVPFFGNMAANGAFARISDRTFDNVVISVAPFDLVIIAFVVALVATVFGVGERLQRDTDGLV
ncbi:MULTISPECIES: DUF2975 domain-containing protein [unclassified Leifsonia]|uniref:DUF2975 domain-containing protein n=1 Tax=unclassified Leifsonia TaxID=2663824 RepID=UPI0006FC5F6C|nr:MULTISPECIES: DUF2975 domain-containing protein [unclassified Leifsonia]KQX08017.1 hypothetical protein ASC59_10015 [Leifsonia sp. Root1293]KRA12298.1 hypothetical protein ASD61_10015 [Leifsonia sp. Root60]